MNRKSKIIKFKKLTHNNPSQSHNFVGFYQQNNQIKKQQQSNKPIINNRQINIKPKLVNNQEEMILKQQFQYTPVKEQKKQQNLKKPFQSKKEQVLNKKFQTQFYFSDNEDFSLSSIKKKTEKVKLSLPKGYNLEEPILQLRNQLIDSLSMSEPIISIQQIFSVPLMRSVLGVYQEEERSINFITSQKQKEAINDNGKEQNYQSQQQNQQQPYHYSQYSQYHQHNHNNHNAQIFNAIEMEEEQNQHWIHPQEQNYWNFHQQNQSNIFNTQNHHQNQHFNHQRINPYPGTQHFLSSQNNFFQQMNFGNFPINFDL